MPSDKPSLAETHPDIASQAVGWDARSVTAGSHKKLRWRCERGHEWDAIVKGRTIDGKGCSICAGRKVLIGVNDLATTHPDIASQAVGWNPQDFTAGSNRQMRWRCERGHLAERHSGKNGLTINQNSH